VITLIYYLVIFFAICDDQVKKERELKFLTMQKKREKEQSQLRRQAEKSLPLVARKLNTKSD
jgi:hypothetical protein